MSLALQIQQHYDRFLASIQHRNTNPPTFEWLLQNPNSSHLSDYLKLSQYGRTKTERLLNQALAKLSPTLWFRTIWKRYLRIVLDKTYHKYTYEIVQMLASPQSADHHRHSFITHLNHQFSQKNHLLTQATFTELYLFLNDCLHCFSQWIDVDIDAYASKKKHHNTLCISIYNSIRDEVLAHPHAFYLACYLCIRANWIDCVEDHVDSFLASFLEEINEFLDTTQTPDLLQSHNPYYHILLLESYLTQPQHILYECDNCGEVILDLLLIELLLKKGHRVTIAAKHQPVLNDITFSELQQLLQSATFSHLEPYQSQGQLTLIDTHSRVGGKYLFQVSSDYQKAYQKADFVILKGQGNFQTMPMGFRKKRRFQPYLYHKPIAYMMGVKAPFILDCFKSVLHRQHPPQLQSAFLYVFDSKQPLTFPR